MAKRGSIVVQQTKRVDPCFCGTITVEKQNKMRRAAERRERIANGTLGATGLVPLGRQARRKSEGPSPFAAGSPPL